MTHHTTRTREYSIRINRVDVTGDLLTDRGGIAVFVRYLDGVGILSFLERLFGKARRSSKGAPIAEVFRQLLAFFMDGTSRHLVYFDSLKANPGYAATVETEQGDLLSSHAVKRFFGYFSQGTLLLWCFRIALLKLFLWRLKLAKPSVVVLDLDTMVMDNDEAELRQGVTPTYKKVKGFQPLQLVWGRYIIDAVFRSGDRHSNHGNTTPKMLCRIVRKIRQEYRTDVPIIVRMDSGFYDQKIFEALEKLHVGYLCGGKLYDDIKEYISSVAESGWGTYTNERQEWSFVEFGERRASWEKIRRAVFCRPVYEDRQRLLEFARPDTIIVTNLGQDKELNEQLIAAGAISLIEPEQLIECYHGRGFDELVHRALKDFGFEELPFKRFGANAAFYYTMLLAFFLFETFKEDVTAPVIPLTAYATTVRRQLLDFAGKITMHSRQVVLRVMQATMDRLDLKALWARSGTPPLIL